MLLSKDDIAERNSRITNNNAIDMHVGKRVRLRHKPLCMSQEQLGAYLSASAEIRAWRKPDQRITAVVYQSNS